MMPVPFHLVGSVRPKSAVIDETALNADVVCGCGWMTSTEEPVFKAAGLLVHPRCHDSGDLRFLLPRSSESLCRAEHGREYHRPAPLRRRAGVARQSTQ